MNNLKNQDLSIIFFLPSNKINFYLDYFKIYFLGRKILIARELTKMHEKFYRDQVDSIKNFKSTIKGELTVVISKKYNKKEVIADSDIMEQVKKYLKKYSVKDVVELISKKEEISKNKIYKICLDVKKNEKNY